MTKSNFTKAFVSMSIMASALFFVSCDENKNEPGDEVDPYAIKSLVGEHVVELSEDYLYFFDVTVTYNVDGEEQQLDVDFDGYRNTLRFDTDYCKIPTKISGVCGRLMCCLTNEEETYEELNSNLPAIGDSVSTPEKLRGEVQSVNVLRQLVKVIVTLDNDEKEIREYKVEELRFKPRRKKKDVKLTKEELRELRALEEKNGASKLDDE